MGSYGSEGNLQFFNIIDGKARGAKESHQSIDPRTEEPLWDAPLATTQDLDDAVAAARRGDAATVTSCLCTFAERLDDLGALLRRMNDSCDPSYFYSRIRPFLAGSKNMADAGLPHGVMWDDGSGKSEYVQYSGPSNAQSSLIQFFDIVLGIEHLPTGEKKPAAATADATMSGVAEGVVELDG